MSKYNSRHVSIDGYLFDSIRESQRYSELKLMEKAGEIRDLKVHPAIKLQPSFVYRGETIREITYEADFGYWENDVYVYEDVKGFETSVFKLKWKMLLYQFMNSNIRIKKVK
ncbi:MAG: DUF1064 domain-containing protein [Clostridia bacterium]